jgi:hypothetical protein
VDVEVEHGLPRSTPAGIEQVDAVGAEPLGRAPGQPLRGCRTGREVLVGTTRACPRVAGLMSMNATVRSSSSTIVEGSSPATILQNRQSASGGTAREITRSGSGFGPAPRMD